MRKIHLLTLVTLVACLLLPQVVEARGGILHDVVDDYDRDEFEDYEGEDDAVFKSDQEELEEDLAEEEDDEEEMEEIEVDGGWNDGQDEFNKDEFNDDEFDVPKKRSKKPKKKSTSSRSSTKKQARSSSKKNKASKRSSSKTNAQGKQDPNAALLEPRNYYLEYFAMFLIVVYAMIYFIGSSNNEQKATLFMEQLYPIVRDQFHMVGELTMTVTDTNPTLTTWEARKLLTKESQSQYRLYATGRQYVKGMTIDIQLIDRQDLIYSLLSMVNGARDLISVEIPMEEIYMVGFGGGGGGGKVHSTCFVLVADLVFSLLSRSCLFSLFFLSCTQAPFVLAIVPAKDITKIKDENDDIKELTTEHKQWRAYLPKHLELLSDAR